MVDSLSRTRWRPSWRCLGRYRPPSLRRNTEQSPDAQDVIFLGPTRPLLLRLRIEIDGRPFRQVWQERFDELFALEDHDRDGRVDFDEASAVERDMNGGLRDTGPSGLKSLFEGETIARTALAAHIERTLPPFTVLRRAVIAQGSALALFPLLDTDDDHRLSRRVGSGRNSTAAARFRR